MKEVLTFSREDVNEIYEIPKFDNDSTKEMGRRTDMSTKEIRKLKNEMRQEMDEIQRSPDKMMEKMNDMSKRHERSERQLIQ